MDFQCPTVIVCDWLETRNVAQGGRLMAPSDLQNTYSGMADYELMNLALEIDALTEEAKAALTRELAKRGLGAHEIGAQAEVVQSLKNSSPLRAIPPEDPNTTGGGLTTLALNVSGPALEASRHGRAGWLGEDRARLQFGLGIFLLCFLAYCLLAAFLPIPQAVRATVGKLLGAELVGFFLMRKPWGKGSATLILSIITLFIIAGSTLPLLVNGGANARTGKIVASLISECQEREDSYKRDVGNLGVSTVFEMLDGRRACKTSDLVEMRRKARIAKDKTDQLMTFLESRIKITEAEIIASDPSSIGTFRDNISTPMGATAHHVFSLNKEYFTEIDQLLEFVLSKSGSYQITPNGIKFDHAHDLTEYNRRADEVNQTVAATLRIKGQN